jgi:hypothetical protein
VELRVDHTEILSEENSLKILILENLEEELVQ